MAENCVFQPVEIAGIETRMQQQKQQPSQQQYRPQQFHRNKNKGNPKAKNKEQLWKWWQLFVKECFNDLIGLGGIRHDDRDQNIWTVKRRDFLNYIINEKSRNQKLLRIDEPIADHILNERIEGNCSTFNSVLFYPGSSEPVKITQSSNGELCFHDDAPCCILRERIESSNLEWLDEDDALIDKQLEGKRLKDNPYGFKSRGEKLGALKAAVDLAEKLRSAD
jgi:hypothetical protein